MQGVDGTHFMFILCLDKKILKYHVLSNRSTTDISDFTTILSYLGFLVYTNLIYTS